MTELDAVRAYRDAWLRSQSLHGHAVVAAADAAIASLEERVAKLESQVEFKDKALDGTLAQLREAEAKVEAKRWTIETLIRERRILRRLKRDSEAKATLSESRLSVLQDAAAGYSARECGHDSISEGVCGTCGAYLYAVRLDPDGVIAYVLDYARAEAKVAELAASRLSFADAEVKAHNALRQAEAEVAELERENERLREQFKVAFRLYLWEDTDYNLGKLLEAEGAEYIASAEEGEAS